MERKLLFITFLAILLTNLLGIAIKVETVKASGTIYIRADGSIDPSTANITSVDNVTYIFTGNNYDAIVVERDNIVVDGNGYILQGTGKHVGSGYGIHLSFRSNVTIKNMEIKEFRIGIYLWHSDSNIINWNTVTNNYDGIYLHYSGHNNVNHNMVSNNWDGIELFGSYSNIISYNNASRNNNGIYLMTLTCRTYEYNTITHNVMTNNGRGIWLWCSSGNNVVDNILVKNDEGIYLFCSDGNTLYRNNVTNNHFGAKLGGSGGNTLRNNILIGNNYSFGVYPRNIAESMNDIDISNTVDGLPIYYLVNRSNLAIEPYAYPNLGYLGIVKSNNITVQSLNLTNNGQGILLAFTVNSIIEDVNIFNNLEGILLVCSNNNTIYHNNFVDNTQQVYDYSSNYPDIRPSINSWDGGCEGNFWSDFAGSDSNGDGIGDTPYVITGSNQDDHPLMNPYWNPTDINHDLKVDILDVMLACVAYSSTPSDLNWNCHCDIAEPYEVIDIFDIVMICSSYGEEYTP